MLLVLCTAGAASFEALLYAKIGDLVTWLSQGTARYFPCATLAEPYFAVLYFIGQYLFCQCAVNCEASNVIQWFSNAFALAFPQFRMLQQSLDFFHNDFAGRLSAKSMQTALAVREFWVILGDMLAYVFIYFITISLVLGAQFLQCSFCRYCYGWLYLFLQQLIFIPRSSKSINEQADARLR